MKKKSNTHQKKEDNFFTILFFLLVIYITLLGGAIKLIESFSSKGILSQEENILNVIYGEILIWVGIIVGFYLFLIVSITIYEFNSYYSQMNKNQKDLQKKFREFVLSTPSQIISIILPLFAILGIVLLVYFRYPIGIILMIFYLISLIYLIAKRKLIRENLAVFLLRKEKFKLKNIFFLLYSIILILSLIFSAFFLVMFSTTHFSVELDKEIYFIGEPVYVTIQSKGILKPIPLTVTYSNEKIPLDYIKHPQFELAPLYIKINSDLLKPEPYNSYIQINYKLNKFSWIYPQKLSYDKMIPVIKS